ncbi:LppX_LprAFG lipoprotein [Mycobacterium sp. 050134]|uniref:LppX_LprAFG lipoprotein n=1 Tax=Mycobacterium sp. 050134 TaxID=3096111 RepID=UPI002ED86F6B
MQTRRRLSAVLASVSLAVAPIAACSFSSSPSGGPLPDGKTLVQQSATTTKNLKSAHLVLTVTGKIAGLPVRNLTGDLTTSPETAAKGNAQITYLGSDISADFVVVGGDLYTNALSPGDPTMTDVGPASQVYDPSALLSPDTGVANVLANFSDAKSEGRDQVSGQTTVRVSGNVSADAVNKIASPFKATKPVPATAWIVESGDHQLAQISLQQSPGNSVQMTLSNWGQPVQVSKPAGS